MGTNGGMFEAHTTALSLLTILQGWRDMVFPAGGAQSWRNGSADTTNSSGGGLRIRTIRSDSRTTM